MLRRTPRRPRPGAWLAALVLVLVTSSASSQAPLELRVERGPGAQSCPDPQSLRARVEALRGPGEGAIPRTYQLDFARSGSGFEATLHARDRRNGSESVRVLRAPGDSCAGLAEACAVTLSLLLDAELPVSAPEPVAAQSPEPEPLPPRGAAPPREHPTVRAVGSAGAVGVFGLMRSSLPGLLIDAGVELRRVRLSLGALWSWRDTVRLGPGTLRESLLSGFARACAPALHGSWLHLDLCTGAYVGAFRVQARGYTRDDQSTRLWLAAPAELALSAGSRRVRAELAVGALFSLHPPDFTVAGVGAAYRSWPVSPFVSLRLVGFVPR